MKATKRELEVWVLMSLDFPVFAGMNRKDRIARFKAGLKAKKPSAELILHRIRNQVIALQRNW